jgi:hypothetical protein
MSLYTPYRALFTVSHPRGRIRQGPYLAISGIRPYPSGLDPASTQPRRSAQSNREGRTAWHGALGHFAVSSPTSPWCPGMAGHYQGTSPQSLLQGSIKRHLRAPRRPGLLLPYKRAGRALQRGQKTENNRPHTSPKPSAKHSKAPHTEINISSNHLCTLFSSL